MRRLRRKTGFTLIELSIVLVITGLIVGGILVGHDLIKAAEVRAQISQIEKYNQAANTFRDKFQALPGDMAMGTASQFGFTIGGGCTGAAAQRDGNGLIDGWSGGIPLVQGGGETQLFWQDISSPIAGNLIDGNFPNNGGQQANCYSGGSAVMSTTPGTSYVGDYLPAAKIGHGNFVYVYDSNGFNWYGVSAVTSDTYVGNLLSNTSTPVIEVYRIDTKIDDGVPTTGAVQANYLNNSRPNGTLSVLATAPRTAADTTTTCYNTTSNTYSISSLANYGAGGNCALSFRFQ